MKNVIIEISENVENAEIHKITVSKRRLSKLQCYCSLGGFKRYHIDVYDFTESKNTHKSDLKPIFNKIFPELKHFSKLI